jgi:glycosyltransferase involved in cell wall biosynthesis
VFFVQLPPTPLLYLVTIYRWLTGNNFVADCHNAMVDGPWIKFPFARSLLSSTLLTIVHNDQIARLAEAKNLYAHVVRDPLPVVKASYEKDVLEKYDIYEKEYVLLPWNFAADEPLVEFAQAAQCLPDTRFVATWFAERLPEHVKNIMPSNVVFTGFLPENEFDQIFAHSGVVLSLTVREGTQPSAASEAIAFEIPLVISDLHTTRELYGDVPVYVENTPQKIAAGLRFALDNRQLVEEKMKELKRVVDTRLSEELNKVESIVCNAD